VILGNPVRGTIYLTASGSRLYRSQRFGCTGYPAELPLGNCAHFHRGVDIAPSDGRTGIPVYAAAAGTVMFDGTDTFGSIDVTINHGSERFTIYAHLAREIVNHGQHVSKGDQIGVMGKTGNATGIHLHFAYKTGADPSGTILGDGNGTFRDPWPLLEQNVKVRLVGKDGINVRRAPGGEVYAKTAGGRLRKVNADGRLGTDIGSATAWHKWGGNVASSALGQSFWRKYLIGGTYFVVGDTVSEQSVS
jgi:murein DD-endopeptidase MepM/ murein hydrolase activator NlpD